MNLFYVDPKQSPELVPMWEAFAVFSHAYLRIDGEERITTKLKEYDITDFGVGAIIAGAYRQEEEKARIAGEIKSDVREFLEVEKLADALAGENARRRAAAQHNLVFFSEASGISESRIQQLFTAWSTDPRADSSVEQIAELNRLLDTSDWNNFRKYLLAEVAEGMGALFELEPALDTSKGARK